MAEPTKKRLTGALLAAIFALALLSIVSSGQWSGRWPVWLAAPVLALALVGALLHLRRPRGR